MKKLSSVLLIFLSLAGIIDATYISYQRWLNIVPPCVPGFQCETVLNSPYSGIGPVPLSVLGMFYYLTVFILAALILLDVPLPAFLHWLRRAGAKPVDLLRLVTSFGLLFSGYLVILMGVVLQAWCTYCLISAAICVLLFIASWWHARLTRMGDSYFIRGIWFKLVALLYALLGKPLFFLLDPEYVHTHMVSLGAALSGNSVGRWLLRSALGFRTPESSVTFAGIRFPNRIGLSAGYDYNADLTEALEPVGFGWQSVGTVTFEAYEGNPKPRLTRLAESKAILVNKGLKNIGAAAIVEKLRTRQMPIPVAISIASTNRAFGSDREQILDIAQCFRVFERARLPFQLYELNISCPNTHGGEPFTTPRRLEPLLRVVDRIASKPVFVKLPIDLPEQDFLALLAVCDRHAVAGIIIGNLLKDKNSPELSSADRLTWQRQPGNVSGRPTFARSNALIALANRHFGSRFVIVGTGGIFSVEDAQTKLAAGADLVQLITGMIYQGPQLIGEINRRITIHDPEAHASIVSAEA